jgi:Histidine kinase
MTGKAAAALPAPSWWRTHRTGIATTLTLYGLFLALGRTVAQVFFLLSPVIPLSAGIWWVAGRVAWPERFTWKFASIHLLLGIAFALAWRGPFYLQDALAGEVREQYGFEIVACIWLYGCIAGTSYAIRSSRLKVQAQEGAEQAEAVLARARLETLKADLDPAYLFSVLDAITAIVRQDHLEAARLLHEFARLVRYVLDHQSTDYTSLGSELRFARRYLGLLACVEPEWRKPHVEVAVELHDQYVPALLLQSVLLISTAMAPRSYSLTAALDRNGRIGIEACGLSNRRSELTPDTRSRLDRLADRLAGLYGDGFTVSLREATAHRLRLDVAVPVDE